MSFVPRNRKLLAEYYSLILGGVAAFGVTVSMIPEILFKNRFRNMTSYKEKDGSEKKIDPVNQELITKVLNKIDMTPEEEAITDFYISAVSDPIHYGSSKMRAGSAIGLPVSMQYNKDVDLSKESFSFNGIRLVFDDTSNSPAAKELAEAFAISQKAKAFVIAREIYYSSSYRIHFDTMIRLFYLSGIVITWHYVYDRIKFIPRLKLWAKGIMLGGICAVWSLMYLFVKDAHNCWIDWAVDRRTGKLSKSFAQGGVEYYDSILKRNKALRILTYDGKSHFTPFGNTVARFRQASLQITTRRQNMAKYLANYDKIEEKKVAAVPANVEKTEKGVSP